MIMRKSLRYPVIALFLIAAPAYAQQDSLQRYDLITLVEDDFYLEKDTDTEVHLPQDTINLGEKTFNINELNASQLKTILKLSNKQVEAFFSYKNRYGPLLSIYELKYLDNFDMATNLRLAQILSVYCDVVPDRTSFLRSLHYMRHEVLIRYDHIHKSPDEEEEAIPNTMPGRTIMRYNLNAGNRLLAGITCETDKGEKTGWPDYFSPYVLIKNLGPFRKIIIGDFDVGFGQGLTVNTSVSIGKIAGNMIAQKYLTGIKPHTSTIEYGFKRGIAAETDLGIHWKLILFFSRKGTDGRIQEYDSVNEKIYTVSLPGVTGLHRTDNEISGKNLLKLQEYGGQIRYRHSDYEISLHGVVSRFDHLIDNNNSPYNRFRFSGLFNFASSISIRWIIKKINFFHEASLSRSGGYAIIAGFSSRVTPAFYYTLVIRRYSKNFQNLNARSIGENSGSTGNESGILLGMTAKIIKGLDISLYADHFQFPWLKYLKDSPTRGCDYSLSFLCTPVRSVNIQLRYKWKALQISMPGTDKLINNTEWQYRHRIRLNIAYTLNDMELRNRFEWVHNREKNSKPGSGYLMYQDIIYTFQRIPLKVYFRYQLFNTDSFNERIYVYENDVLYSFQVPAFFDNGNRVYLLIKYTLFHNFDSWLKLGLTGKYQLNMDPSSEVEVRSEKTLDARIQLRIRL